MINVGKDLGELEATDMMARDVFTVTEEMLVEEVVDLLQEQHLIRVPAVKGNLFIGVVARRDIVFGYVWSMANSWP